MCEVCNYIVGYTVNTVKVEACLFADLHLHNLAQGLGHADNQEMCIIYDMYMRVYVSL